MFVLGKVLEDRDSVSFRSKGQACLLSIRKDLGFQILFQLLNSFLKKGNSDKGYATDEA